MAAKKRQKKTAKKAKRAAPKTAKRKRTAKKSRSAAAVKRRERRRKNSFMGSAKASLAHYQGRLAKMKGEAPPSGLPAAVLELEGIWDDKHEIASSPKVVSVLERHGVAAAEAKRMAPAIRRGLARHAKAHGGGGGLARHKRTPSRAQSAAHHTRGKSGHAHRPPATEWERLWKAYTEANRVGSLKQQLAAGRQLLRWDRTHGTPALPHVVTALRQARDLLRQHAQAYKEAKALHQEIRSAAGAMDHHHARLTGHRRATGAPRARTRGLGAHKRPAAKRGMFAVL